MEKSSNQRSPSSVAVQDGPPPNTDHAKLMKFSVAGLNGTEFGIAPLVFEEISSRRVSVGSVVKG